MIESSLERVKQLLFLQVEASKSENMLIKQMLGAFEQIESAQDSNNAMFEKSVNNHTKTI